MVRLKFPRYEDDYIHTQKIDFNKSLMWVKHNNSTSASLEDKIFGFQKSLIYIHFEKNHRYIMFQ